jgi:hypothetical protein
MLEVLHQNYPYQHPEKLLCGLTTSGISRNNDQNDYDELRNDKSTLKKNRLNSRIEKQL